MSGQLPRSTQYGKKIRNFILPNVSGTLENGLSPYLGHPVVPVDDPNFYNNRNGDSFHVESSISSLSDIESWDTGSTSSASWFDEFDQVATQQINKELKDIDSVLYDEADVSILRSDLHEECQEWKDAFPHLRITGTGVKHCPLQTTIKRKGKDIEETKSFSVISKSSPVLYNNNSKSFHNKSDKISNKTNNNVIEMESFLRISPISFFDATDKHQTSAASIVRSELTSSKWRRNTSPEFSSLPYIPTPRYNNSSSISTLSSSSSSHRDTNSNRKTLEPLVRKSQHHQRSIKSGKSDHFYQTLPLRTKPLILPPIEQLSISKESNFRSISATPRNSVFYQGFVENAYRKFGTTTKCTQIVEQQSNKIAYRNVNNNSKDVEKVKNVVKPKSNYK